MFKKDSGRSLLEIMAAIGIISLLVIGVVKFANKNSDGLKKKQIVIQIDNLKDSIQSVYMGQKSFSSLGINYNTDIGSAFLIARGVRSNLFLDPWGNEIELKGSDEVGNEFGEYRIKIQNLDAKICAYLEIRFEEKDLGDYMEKDTCGTTSSYIEISSKIIP